MPLRPHRQVGVVHRLRQEDSIVGRSSYNNPSSGREHLSVIGGAIVAPDSPKAGPWSQPVARSARKTIRSGPRSMPQYAPCVYKSFSIAGFRGINSLKLAQLGKVNLLTGLNDAGKTSVLEALFLHASGPLAATSALQTLLPGRQQEILAVGQSVGSPWATLFPQLSMAAPILLEAKTQLGAYSLRLEADSSGITQAVLSREGARNNRLEESKSLSIVERRGVGPEKAFRQSIVAQANGLGTSVQNFSVEFRLDPATATPYLPAAFIRSQVSYDIVDSFSSDQLNPSGINVLEALRLIDDRIQDLTVLTSAGRSQLYAKVNGRLLPVQLLGDGVLFIMRALYAMIAARGGVLLVDEIGAGVHHSVQTQMWEILFRAASHLKVQIFATTHSQEVVTAAKRAITTGGGHALAVYRLSRPVEQLETTVTAYADAVLEAAVEMNADIR